MNAIAEIIAAVVVGWFIFELGMAHYFGKAGMPTHGNPIAHWFYDRHHHHLNRRG